MKAPAERPRPGSALAVTRRALVLAIPACLLVLLLRYAGWLQTPGLQLLDRMAAASLQPGESPDVVVVGFGETDFVRFDNYPFSDQLLAEVLERIQRAGPSAVFLNLLRDAPVPPGHEVLLDQYRQMPGLVGFAAMAPLARQDVAAPPVLRDDPKRFGFLNSLGDADGIHRRVLLAHQGEGLLESALLRLLRVSLGQESVAVGVDGSLTLGGRRIAAVDAHYGEYRLEDVGGLRAYLIAPRHRSVPVLGFAELLEGRFDPTLLAGKVVFVGTTASSIQRGFHTPLAPPSGRGLSGVELNARQFDALLGVARGESLAPAALPEAVEWLLLFAVAFLSLVVFLRVRSLFAGLVVGCCLIASTVLLALACLWVGLWLPLAALVATVGVSALVAGENLLRAVASQRRLFGFIADVFDRLPDPMCVLDHRGRFRLLNEAFSRLAALPPDELIGRTSETLLQRRDDQWCLDAHGRQQALLVDQASMTDEHGRPLRMVTIRGVLPSTDAAGDLHRDAALRTALWWAARGRGTVLLARLSAADEADAESPGDPAAERNLAVLLAERLRGAFPDALDLRQTDGGVDMLLARPDRSFDAARLETLIRQSLSWPLATDGEPLETRLRLRIAVGGKASESAAALRARAAGHETIVTVG